MMCKSEGLLLRGRSISHACPATSGDAACVCVMLWSWQSSDVKHSYQLLARWVVSASVCVLWSIHQVWVKVAAAGSYVIYIYMEIFFSFPLNKQCNVSGCSYTPCASQREHNKQEIPAGLHFDLQRIQFLNWDAATTSDFLASLQVAWQPDSDDNS